MNISRNFAKMWLMMFLQFIQFAVWWVPLAAYLTNLGIGGVQKALILSSTALGCIVAPLIGGLADRYFPSEKVLLGLNIITASLLFSAGFVTNPNLLFILLLIAMFAYMPTWGITSVIAMTHSPSELFPRIRMGGSIGWVASGAFSLLVARLFELDFDGTKLPFFFGASLALLAAFVNLTLPNTPPLAKGQTISLDQALGLKTISLMKNKDFFIFIMISFLAFIPFALYWSYLSQFLQSIGYKYITVTMNWGQVAEMVILFFIPGIIKKFGLRITMILGLIALVLRYVAFYYGTSHGLYSLLFTGIIVHGVIFGFFSVGGQIYINKVTPPELKAQAQGFIFLITFGLGILVGNFLSAWLIDYYTVIISSDSIMVQWEKIWEITSICSLLILVIFSVFFKYRRKG